MRQRQRRKTCVNQPAERSVHCDCDLGKKSNQRSSNAFRKLRCLTPIHLAGCLHSFALSGGAYSNPCELNRSQPKVYRKSTWRQCTSALKESGQPLNSNTGSTSRIYSMEIKPPARRVCRLVCLLRMDVLRCCNAYFCITMHLDASTITKAKPQPRVSLRGTQRNSQTWMKKISRKRFEWPLSY